jgi:hypothetical protein
MRIPTNTVKFLGVVQMHFSPQILWGVDQEPSVFPRIGQKKRILPIKIYKYLGSLFIFSLAWVSKDG